MRPVRPVRLNPSIEPVVRLIEETPRNQLLEVMAAEIQKGLSYNQTLEADALQAARGWQTEVAYNDRTGILTLSVQDRAGAPVSGLHIGAKLGRPATDVDDRRVVLTEASAGVYAATVDLAPGLWVISVASREAGEDRAGAYRLKRRLFVAEQP